LWRRSEKLAAWLLLPGLGVILALASHLSLVSDAGCRRDPPNCVGVAPAVGAVVYGGCLVLAGVAVFLVLLRLGRAGAARARALPGQDTAMSLSTSAEGAHRTHWWVPVLVLAGTGIGTLAAGAVPALLQGHTFPGSLDGVTGYLVWTGGRAQVLAGIAWVAPFWLAGTALLLRSALWGHWTKAAGALTAPILLAVALFATSGSVLTESRWHALPGIAATLGGIGLLITLMVTVRGLAVDAASPPAEQPASLG
jgi:hypothetical protein